MWFRSVRYALLWAGGLGFAGLVMAVPASAYAEDFASTAAGGLDVAPENAGADLTAAGASDPSAGTIEDSNSKLPAVDDMTVPIFGDGLGDDAGAYSPWSPGATKPLLAPRPAATPTRAAARGKTDDG